MMDGKSRSRVYSVWETCFFCFSILLFKQRFEKQVWDLGYFSKHLEQLKVHEHVKDLQPLWLLAIAGPVKVVMTFAVFGFGVRFSSEASSSAQSELKAFATSAMQWIFFGLAVKTLVEDAMKVGQLKPDSPSQLTISLVFVFVTSSNYLSACSALSAISPQEIFGVSKNPRSEESGGWAKKSYMAIMNIYLEARLAGYVFFLVGFGFVFLDGHNWTDEEVKRFGAFMDSHNDVLPRVVYLLVLYGLVILFSLLAALSFCLWKVGLTGAKRILPTLTYSSYFKHSDDESLIQLLARDIGLWEMQTKEFHDSFTTYHPINEKDCDPKLAEALTEGVTAATEQDKAVVLQMLIIYKTSVAGCASLVVFQMAILCAVRIWPLEHPQLVEFYSALTKIWDDRSLEQYWGAMWSSAQSLPECLNSISKFLWQI